MAWEKLGCIFAPNNYNDWICHSVLTPTPILIDDETIRIYASFRDQLGRGRIGFLDLNARKPTDIICISESPVLDLGRAGCFDDNGMLLGDVIRVGGDLYMYYIGFQLVHSVKFFAFTGLAISKDNGISFERYQETPIFDRVQNAKFIRAIHTVSVENGIFRVWYAAGDSWKTLQNNSYPEYHIRYTESLDGISFPDSIGTTCLEPNINEYRIGRPRVRKLDVGYEMHFTSDSLNKEYRAGVAFSNDGIKWVGRKEFDIPVSNSGWDSLEVSYPCILETKYGKYAFYDGNQMGREGFGCAKWVPD